MTPKKEVYVYVIFIKSDTEGGGWMADGVYLDPDWAEEAADKWKKCIVGAPWETCIKTVEVEYP